MSSRHTRRKRSKAKQQAKLETLARAERSRQIAETVRRNKTADLKEQTVLVNQTTGKARLVSGNYYPTSLMGRLGGHSHRGYVCGHATGTVRSRPQPGRFK